MDLNVPFLKEKKDQITRPKKEKKSKKMNKKQELEQIVSTQSFSPIRDVKDGIIITKDGRFIKLMEVMPINFSLRSYSEQASIISSFAKALRNMPSNVQFKIVSKRADVSQFVDKIKNEMALEKNSHCQRLQQEQINLISSVGSSQGVSRRFFLIFEYEQKVGFQHRPTFDQVRRELEREARNIANDISDCGNEVVSVSDSDEYILEVLYSIMSRSESSIRSARDREYEVLGRYAAGNMDFTRKDLHIPVNDFIAPTLIDDRSSPRYLVVDDLFYMYCYIPGGSYPIRALGGWMLLLINMGEGVDVDFWIKKENIATTQRKLQYRLRWNKVRMRETEDTSQDFEDLHGAIESGYYLKSGLSAGEDFCYMATLITITGHSLQEVNYKYEAIKRHCIRNDIRIKPCHFQQLEAWQSSLPICKCDPGIWAKGRRNGLTRDLASAYPFVSYELADENGILLGANSNNGSLVFVDVFDTSKYNNANIAILGSSGSGKTYTLQCMALRMRQKQVQVFIIAPLKGIEFERACAAIGGSFIRIAPGSGNNINIMEIRKKTESIDDYDTDFIPEESILVKKIQQLHAFFTLLLKDITFEEQQLLDESLLKTYAKFGITPENDSLVDPETGEYKKMPILGDLYETLREMERTDSRLYGALTRYVTGSAKSFNQPTNVNLDNKYVVLDVSSLTKETLPIGMFIALDYAWDKAREDRTKKKVIFIDETWRLVGPGSSELAAEFVLEIFKVIRGYGGSAVCATQDLNDFFALKDGMYGAGIINNAKTKMLMKTEPREASVVAQAMDLTREEAEEIKGIKRGTCLLAANTNHVFIDIKASKTEHDLITTDAQELRRLALERMAKEELME
ncbi:VirB4 family type IV secretion system protein [Peptococcus simiae]|uniref:VirB4 family type IV secretion system protein n=1 Tax=Peptococcus simiae TaxID=1643805 RepID=UPI0039814744